jgi:Alcohol dehydrogenase GroES-like domain
VGKTWLREAASRSQMIKAQVRVSTFDGPGAKPVLRTVPWPTIPDNAALLQIGASGVCGTDQHTLKGHWPKPLPWPFTLGHEIGAVMGVPSPLVGEGVIARRRNATSAIADFAKSRRSNPPARSAMSEAFAPGLLRRISSRSAIAVASLAMTAPHH